MSRSSVLRVICASRVSISPPGWYRNSVGVRVRTALVDGTGTDGSGAVLRGGRSALEPRLPRGNALFGPLGAAAGLVWGIVENAEANRGLNIVARDRPPTTRSQTSPEIPAPAKWCDPSGLPCRMPDPTCS
jgi:hypothetical protein